MITKKRELIPALHLDRCKIGQTDCCCASYGQYQALIRRHDLPLRIESNRCYKNKEKGFLLVEYN